MKKFSLFFSLVALAPFAGAQIVTFNAPGEFGANYNQNNAVLFAGIFSENAAGGISGTGSVAVASATANTDATATYKSGSFNFTLDGGVLQQSIFFQLGSVPSSNGQKPMQLGYVTSALGAFNGDAQQIPILAAFITLRLNGNATGNQFVFEGQEKPTTGGTASFNPGGSGTQLLVTLSNNTWYKLSLSVLNTAGVGAYTISGLLEDFGATGTSLVGTVATFAPTSRTLATIESTTLFAGFRSTMASNTVSVDNHNVPEPSAILSLLGGTGVLLGLGRARRFR